MQCGHVVTIWNIPPTETKGILAKVVTVLVERSKAFALVLTVGLLLIGSLVISTVLSGLGERASDSSIPYAVTLWNWLTIGVAFVLNVIVFALMFYFLPKPKLYWRDVIPGAILTALLWEIGKQILSRYLGGNNYTASATVAGRHE